MAANEKDTSKELLFYLLDAADRLETIQIRFSPKR